MFRNQYCYFNIEFSNGAFSNKSLKAYVIYEFMKRSQIMNKKSLQLATMSWPNRVCSGRIVEVKSRNSRSLTFATFRVFRFSPIPSYNGRRSSQLSSAAATGDQCESKIRSNPHFLYTNSCLMTLPLFTGGGCSNHRRRQRGTPQVEGWPSGSDRAHAGPPQESTGWIGQAAERHRSRRRTSACRWSWTRCHCSCVKEEEMESWRQMYG